jgi:hypothetical protein
VSNLREQILQDLNKPRGDGLKIGLKQALHEKQLELLTPILRDKKKITFGACGRKFGKSRATCYLAWRWALLNPNSSVYIVCPEGTHGRRIYWKDARIYQFLGVDSKKYILGKPNSRELTINFKNGSNIQIMGSDNYMAANGLTPDLVIYDEFKGFHPEFHTQMDPNRAAKAAPLLIIGTLAEDGIRNKDEYYALLEDCEEHPEDTPVFKYGTFDNPINQLPGQKEAILKQIELLRRQGKEHVVQREYFSKIIPGGETAIFPYFNPDEHVFPHEELVQEINKDVNNLEWCVSIDPGNRTVFASVMAAHDPENSVLYVLDENYARTQSETLISKFMAALRGKMLSLYPSGDLDRGWAKVCDEQAAWAILETLGQFNDMAFMKSNKNANKKDYGITLLNEAMQKGLIKISDRCTNLIKEITDYHMNKQGRIPKVNDHGIDALRYLIHHINYTIVPDIDYKEKRDYRDDNSSIWGDFF